MKKTGMVLTVIVMFLALDLFAGDKIMAAENKDGDEFAVTTGEDEKSAAGKKLVVGRDGVAEGVRKAQEALAKAEKEKNKPAESPKIANSEAKLPAEKPKKEPKLADGKAPESAKTVEKKEPAKDDFSKIKSAQDCHDQYEKTDKAKMYKCLSYRSDQTVVETKAADKKASDKKVAEEPAASKPAGKIKMRIIKGDAPKLKAKSTDVKPEEKKSVVVVKKEAVKPAVSKKKVTKATVAGEKTTKTARKNKPVVKKEKAVKTDATSEASDKLFASLAKCTANATDNALVKKGYGYSQVIACQLMAGGMKTDDAKKKAREIAVRDGYIKKDGSQTRLRGNTIGKVEFKLNADDSVTESWGGLDKEKSTYSHKKSDSKKVEKKTEKKANKKPEEKYKGGDKAD
jgi:hypothetical protein